MNRFKSRLRSRWNSSHSMWLSKFGGTDPSIAKADGSGDVRRRGAKEVISGVLAHAEAQPNDSQQVRDHEEREIPFCTAKHSLLETSRDLYEACVGLTPPDLK